MLLLGTAAITDCCRRLLELRTAAPPNAWTKNSAEQRRANFSNQ
jgi:hypothetical protein